MLLFAFHLGFVSFIRAIILTKRLLVSSSWLIEKCERAQHYIVTDIDNSRTQPPKNGTVAARIKALQEGWHTDHRPTTGPPPRRTLTLTHTSTGGIVIGRGRRRDTSFASPASRVSRDRADGARRDGRPPVGIVPHVSHPSYEEKEIYFRPFSRASELTPSPQSVPRPQVAIVHGRTSSTDQSSQPTDLPVARARSRSKSIAQPNAYDNTSTDQEVEKVEMTIDELGSLLDDAIELNTSTGIPHTDTRRSSAQVSHISAAVDPLRRSPSNLILASANPSADDPVKEKASVNTKVDHEPPVLTKTAHLDRLQDVSEESRRWATSAHKRNSSDGTIGTLKRTANLFRRYSSRTPDVTPLEPCKEQLVPQYSPNNASLQLSVSPVKERAAIFEPCSETSRQVGNGLQRTGSGSVQPKADWSQYQKSSAQRFSLPPLKKILHHKRATSSAKTGSSLIPLTLPSIVKNDNAKDFSASLVCEAPEVATSKPPELVDVINNHDTEPQTEATRSSSPEITHDIRDGLSEAISRKENTSKKITDEAVDLRSSIKKKPSKWDLLQRHKISRSMQQPESTDTANNSDQSFRSAHSSVVESRIRDLMAASKQSNVGTACPRRNASNVGRIKQSRIYESVADHDQLHRRNFSYLRMPIAEPARAVASNDTLRAPHNSPNHFKVAGDGHESNGIINAPIKSYQTPTTPSRGRSRNVKQSLSPRGIPYAIEQRFSLSPSRSHSRHGGNGVFVSVEVRSSPERLGDGSEEHEVIVRASVEPEEIFDDEEEQG